MTSRARRVVGVAVFALSIGASHGAFAQTASRMPPTEEELATARQLFQEAYADEQAGRFADALEKFKKVAEVKESAAVRYRIGACLEGLKRVREARDAYRAIAANRDLAAPAEREIAESAAQRAVLLDRSIPRVVVSVADGAPPGVVVRLDGAPIPKSGAVEVDPGDHVVQATADDAKPFESKFTLAAGAEQRVNVVFDTPAAPPPPPPPRRPLLGWVLVGVGGVFLVAGGVTIGVREGNISELNDACPGGQCPTGRRSELENTRDAAEMQGPLAGAFIAAGVITAGVGAYMLLRPPRARTKTGIGSVWVSARPARGGSMLSSGLSF